MKKNHQLLELKITVEKIGRGDGVTHFYILEERMQELYVCSYIQGNRYEKNVTDLANDFCDEITSFDIEDWGKHEYQFHLDYTSILWKVKIKTTKMHIDCFGEGVFPNNWDEFFRVLNRFAIPS